jgi:hypothetical protein
MNLKKAGAAKAVRVLVAAVSIYVIMLTIGFMSWRRPDALMAAIWSRFLQVENGLAAIAKNSPPPSPVSPSPKPQRQP